MKKSKGLIMKVVIHYASIFSNVPLATPPPVAK